MRIIHICQFLGVGGLEQVLYLTIKEQFKAGHEVEVVVYDRDRRWVEKFRQLSIIVHTDYTKKPGIDRALLAYLQKKIVGFDVVHTHDLNPGFYLSILRFLSLFRQKFIHTTHGMEHIKEDPKTRIHEILLGFAANKIITVSPKFREYYQAQLLTKSSKVSLIDNGVNIELGFQKQSTKNTVNDLKIDTTHPIAIYVARVVPLKGQFELIQTYRNLSDQLLLVGPSGDDAYFEKCRSALSPNVHMLGSRSDISELLDGADYYVSHSFHEGLPISVLEAGSRKLPCLLFDIPGHQQFNQESETVVLFNNENFRERLGYLREHKTRLEQSFFQLIIDKYSIAHMTKKVLALYREVVGA